MKRLLLCLLLTLMSIHYSFRFEVDSEELNIKSCEEETLQKFFSKKIFLL